MRRPTLITLPPIQTLRSIYGTRFTRPGFTAANPSDDPSLMQMDAPHFLPGGTTVRTGHPHAPEAIIHHSFYPRPGV